MMRLPQPGWAPAAKRPGLTDSERSRVERLVQLG